MNIKVLGGNTQTKRFDSVEDFNEYYTKHKAEMDSMTTQRLNKLFTIEGYHIVRRSESICVLPVGCMQNDKPVRTKDLAKQLAEVKNNCETLAADLAATRSEVTSLREVVNELLNYLNPQSHHRR